MYYWAVIISSWIVQKFQNTVTHQSKSVHTPSTSRYKSQYDPAKSIAPSPPWVLEYLKQWSYEMFQRGRDSTESSGGSPMALPSATADPPRSPPQCIHAVACGWFGISGGNWTLCKISVCSLQWPLVDYPKSQNLDMFLLFQEVAG